MLLQESEYEKQTSLNPKSFWGIWSRLTTDDYAKDSCSLIKNSFFFYTSFTTVDFSRLISKWN